MITHEQKERLKKMIGPRHVAQLSRHFIETSYYNKFDQPYTSEFISRVFNGRVQHLELEKEIFAFAEKRRKEDQEEAQRRENILQGNQPTTTK